MEEGRRKDWVDEVWVWKGRRPRWLVVEYDVECWRSWVGMDEKRRKRWEDVGRRDGEEEARRTRKTDEVELEMGGRSGIWSATR